MALLDVVSHTSLSISGATHPTAAEEQNELMIPRTLPCAIEQ